MQLFLISKTSRRQSLRLGLGGLRLAEQGEGALLMDRRLQSRATPAGRPILNGWVSSLFGMRADPLVNPKEYISIK